MNRLQTFQIFPDIPEPLSFLETLSRNLWWSWNLDAIELFRRIDPRLWEESGRNPILFSTLISQERMESLAEDVEISTRGIKSVSLVGSDEKLEWSRDKEGLHVTLPEQKPCDLAYTLKIQLKGDWIR